MKISILKQFFWSTTRAILSAVINAYVTYCAYDAVTWVWNDPRIPKDSHIGFILVALGYVFFKFLEDTCVDLVLIRKKISEIKAAHLDIDTDRSGE